MLPDLNLNVNDFVLADGHPNVQDNELFIHGIGLETGIHNFHPQDFVFRQIQNRPDKVGEDFNVCAENIFEHIVVGR